MAPEGTPLPSLSSRRYVRAGAAAALVLAAGIAYVVSERRTFAGDVRAICNAESRTETTVVSARVLVEAAARKSMLGDDGIALVDSLKAAPPDVAARRLQAAADKVGVADCPTAKGYDALAGRTALQHSADRMCSRMDPMELSRVPRARRFTRLREWAHTEVGDPALDAMLESRDAGTLQESTSKLRVALSDLDVHTCSVLAGLASPLDPVVGPNVLVQSVALPSDAREAAVAESLRAKVPAFRRCYEDGLAKDPKLAGTMSLKFHLTERGAIDFALAQDDSTLTAPAVVGCMTDVVKTATGPAGSGKSPGGLIVVFWVAR